MKLNCVTRLNITFILSMCVYQTVLAQTNFIVNGTFDSGTSGWTLSTASWNNKNGNPTPCLSIGTASQTISGLTIGETYVISVDYYFSSSDTSSIAFVVSVDENEIYEDSSTAFLWKHLTINYTATTTSIDLSFSRISGYTGLVDNITMYAVPEPSTVALLALGLGAIGLVWRRKHGA